MTEQQENVDVDEIYGWLAALMTGISGRTNSDAAKKCSRLIQSLRAQLAEREWVPIEDMPEEWKDGRPVDLLVDGRRFCNSFYSKQDSIWEEKKQIGYSFFDAEEITHAMLPPAPPSPAENKTEGN